jgi:hypothetical protein
MPTITATADNAKAQVRLNLDFSDIDAPYAYVARVDAATGQATAVRGHGSSETISGLPYVPMQAGYKAVLYDTEMPLDQAFYYTASAPSVTLNVTPNFDGGYSAPWYPTSSAVAAVPASLSSGTTYLALVADGSASPTLRGENIPATPGAVFTFAPRLSCAVSQAVTIGLIFRDAAGAVLSAPGAAITVSTATTYSTAQTAPANTIEVQPYVIMTGTPAAGTTLLIYTAPVTNAAGSAQSAGVAVASLGACWLKDPLRPGASVRVDFAFDPNPLCVPAEGVFFQSMDAEQRGANAANFNISDQAELIVVSKVRSSITSTLTLVSRTFADRDRLNVALAPGSPLLFQVPAQYGVVQQYLSIGTTTVSRVLPDHRFPIRVFSLPYTSVAAPGGPMQGTVGARWSDTCNRYATWAAVTAAGLTWTQVLDGAAG